jgi:hypothetical protein
MVVQQKSSVVHTLSSQFRAVCGLHATAFTGGTALWPVDAIALSPNRVAAAIGLRPERIAAAIRRDELRSHRI